MSFFLHEDTVTMSEGMSALHRARQASGYSRFIYSAYSILGIFFYGLGIFTVLGMVMYLLNGNAILSLSTVLFLCYVLLNGITGYGFMFYRKWLLIALSSTLLLTLLLTMLFLVKEMIPRATQMLTSISMVGGTVLFLFLTRRFLSGRYMAWNIVIPFSVLLLVSFLLTNSSMLH